MLNFNPQVKLLGGFLVYMDFYFDICIVIKNKIMTQYQIYLAQKEKCETKGKHKPKENDSGNTFCVICGLLFDNRKSGVKIGEPLKQEDKIIVNKLEGFKDYGN